MQLGVQCDSSDWLVGVLLVLVVPLTGCGAGDGKIDVYPVKGTVTQGGKPVEGADVIFLASDPALKVVGVPTPKAITDANGEFSLSSYGNGDGAPAGEYAVAVSWMQVITPSDNPEQRVERDRLKGRYADPSKSGLTATIQEEDNQPPPFELN